MNNEISKLLQGYMESKEVSGGELIVRKDGQIVHRECFGYSNLERKDEITVESIYRVMSMTKAVTAIAVMQLEEHGLIELDAPVRKYLPEFSPARVVDDPRFAWKGKAPANLPWLLLTFSWKRVRTKTADREPTIRDLLSHASGLEQGIAGMISVMRYRGKDTSLEERIQRYYDQPLDFEPGTNESYSPSAGFDILGLVVQRVSGRMLGDYLKERIFDPLEMKDTTFHLNAEQKGRLVRLYQKKKAVLKDVTDSGKDLSGFLKMGEPHYEAGCGGLYSTAEDYLHLILMLADQGVYKDRRILKAETVAKIHSEAQAQHLEPFPGTTWGLGMLIRQDPQKARTHASSGTYGWSGAFGCHFFISPEDRIEAVFMTNRADAGGSGFAVSKEIENLVFDVYRD